MSRYVVNYDVERQRPHAATNHIMIPAWKIAQELGIVFPLFLSIFFPRSKEFYHGFLKNLTDETPTWCHGLYLHDCSKTYYNSTSKWMNMCVTWDDYKIIKQRWNQFVKIKKQIILKQNKELLTVFPILHTLFIFDERKKLGPYVGLKIELFANIYKIDSFHHYQTDELKYQLIIVDIRFNERKENIVSTHFVFTLNELIMKKYLKDILIGDTIRFNTIPEKYKNPLHGVERVELTKFELLEIIPK